ncbi:glycosyltransferase family 1 protein [Ilyomonas limi]|uniref:Glycosyltransferase family 1 protein n=1 Tax=Ilyomonas limi TaxID=2575867 RepID=A0A4U3L1V9_9BACT|nr:glycosyltransferase [Ilyomonas limi]TKK68209.1 glycosyltransferase family 1 protein [Ilyomonas limi]
MIRRILYIGNSSGFTTSFQRFEALKRLGYTVCMQDPYKAMEVNLRRIISRHIHYRTGYRFLQKKIEEWIKEVVTANQENYDLVWMNSGELIGKHVIKLLHATYKCPIILYNNDDPTGGRDGRRFSTLIKAVPFYDLCIVMRGVNKNEYEKLGAKKVLRATMSYDEVAHHPFEHTVEIPPKLRSEVAFIGTWMRHEKRDTFLLKLIEAGIPVSIWGDRWQKSPLWNRLAPHYRGHALGGRDYVGAIQGAKIVLGLLSKGNRDLHTTRSLEVPYAGGLLCAERTSEHLDMYNEGEEAVFWSDTEECIQVCKKLLADDNLRESIRIGGMRKVGALRVGNEDICRQVLQEVETLKK